MQRIGWAIALWMFVLVGWGIAAKAQETPEAKAKIIVSRASSAIRSPDLRAKSEVDNCNAWFDRCFPDSAYSGGWSVIGTSPWKKSVGGMGSGQTWCTLLPAGRFAQVEGYVAAWLKSDPGAFDKMKRRSDAQVDDNKRCYPLAGEEEQSADGRRDNAIPGTPKNNSGRAL